MISPIGFNLTMGAWLLLWCNVSAAIPQAKLAGVWDCQLQCSGGAIGFGLDIGADPQHAFITNGSERIKVPVLNDGIDSTYQISFEHYDSQIDFRLKDDVLTGAFRKTSKGGRIVQMAFSGKRAPHAQHKTSIAKATQQLISNRWAVKFSSSSAPAVGVFKARDDGSCAGTFLTTTGDYRFLHGKIVDRKLELSCFDGAHAFLFRAELDDHDQLNGDFWSSDKWHETWVAHRDDQAQLPDAFQQTKLVPNKTFDEFKFPDLQGRPTSLVDPKFSANARLIYIFGSWCPNCHDAAVYFKQLKAQYGDKLSILGLAFELTGDFDRDRDQVEKYRARHNVDYPILIAGVSDKQIASQAIPLLDRVRSYPTTIFLDRNNKVVAIHTGFSGPATGDAYNQLQSKFENIISGLITSDQNTD